MVLDHSKVPSGAMETVPVSTFKATCLALLEKVRRTGRPILVTRRGKPLAEIVPPRTPPPRESWLGCMAGSVTIVGDIVQPVAEEKDWEALDPRS